MFINGLYYLIMKVQIQSWNCLTLVTEENKYQNKQEMSFQWIRKQLHMIFSSIKIDITIYVTFDLWLVLF